MRSHVAHDVIEIEGARLEQLASREEQELAGERGRAVSRPADLLERRAMRVRAVQLSQDDFRVARYHRQQVVEVVRDPAGQPPDGLHLLRLHELLLELLALGDVHADAPARPPGDGELVADVRPRDGALRSILAGDRPLPVAVPVSLLRPFAHHPFAILGVRVELLDGGGIADDLLGLVAGDALALLVPEDDAAVVVERVEEHGHVLNELAEALARGRRGVVGLAGLGDVLDDADECDGLAGGVELDGGPAADPPLGAVGAVDPVVPGERTSEANRLGKRLADGFAVVGMEQAEEHLAADRRVWREAQDTERLGRPPHARVRAEADGPRADAAGLEGLAESAWLSRRPTSVLGTRSAPCRAPR